MLADFSFRMVERGRAEVIEAEKLPLSAYLDKKVPIVRPPPRSAQIGMRR